MKLYNIYAHIHKYIFYVLKGLPLDLSKKSLLVQIIYFCFPNFFNYKSLFKNIISIFIYNSKLIKVVSK